MPVITYIPLILQIPLSPNPPALPLLPLPHQSVSPRTGEEAQPQPILHEQLENNPAYWAGVLGGHPTFSVPPPEPTSQVNPYSHPPPGVPVDLHQNLLNLFSNRPNFQQILNQLSQPPPSPSPTFYSPLGAMQDPSWALASSVAQPMSHLLTSPMAPEPVNFVEVNHPNMFPPWAPKFLPPPQQHVFSPYGFPGIMWSQPPPIMSPQPTHMMTPTSQKRRLPPSPEFSPKGDYIGQHSQGLGGHYADSYFKRKKSN